MGGDCFPHPRSFKPLCLRHLPEGEKGEGGQIANGLKIFGGQLLSNSLSLGLRRPSERIHPGGHRQGKCFSLSYSFRIFRPHPRSFKPLCLRHLPEGEKGEGGLR